MARQIEAWQSAGKAVSLVERVMLLDQAAAIDMAKAQLRPTAISGGSLALLELLKGFRLLEEAPPPVDDPFNTFLQAIAADAGG